MRLYLQGTNTGDAARAQRQAQCAQGVQYLPSRGLSRWAAQGRPVSEAEAEDGARSNESMSKVSPPASSGELA